MLVARAFVFGLSARAVLAVLAITVSVAYALVAGAAAAGLQDDSTAVQEARDDPGWILQRPDRDSFDPDDAPDSATTLHVTTHNGTKVATLQPWPYNATTAHRGPYATTPPTAAWTTGLVWNHTAADRMPMDALLVPPDRLRQLDADALERATAAFVPGATPPQTPGLDAVPWQGVGLFYDEGANQMTFGFVLVVIAVGALAALLSAGFAHLEVHARSFDLATLDALAGPRVVRRVVALRIAFLVLAGLAIGTGLALAAVALTRRVLGNDTLGLGLGDIALVWLVVGSAAFVVGWQAARRTLGTSNGLRATRGTTARRFPGPIRFLVVTPRITGGVFAATVVTLLLLTVVLQASAVPVRVFGAEENETVLVNADGNPLRGRVDRFLAEHARLLPGVAAAMPETYAPTILHDRPLLVKGTHIDAWRGYSAPELVRGDWPSAAGEASIGSRAARLHDVSPGDTVVLPASYRQGAEALRIVAVHETGGLSDDELYTDLDTAGRLAGLGPAHVTMLRVRFSEPGLSWSAVAPDQGIEVLDVTLTPTNPVPLTPAVVRVQATNFDDRQRERILSVRLDGNLSGSQRVTLGPHESTSISFPVVAPRAARFQVSVNPTQDVATDQARLLIETPGVVRPGAPFPVVVRDLGLQPVANAEILVDGTPHSRTDRDGRTTLALAHERLAVLSVRTADAAAGTTIRVAPAEWDTVARPVVERLATDTPRPLNDTHYRVRLVASVANLGGRSSEVELPWQVDGTRVATDMRDLSSGTRTTLERTITVAFGTHVFALLGTNVTQTVTGRDVDTSEEEALSIPELIERRRAATSGIGGDPTQAFLAKLFADLAIVASLVAIATALYGAILVWVTVQRDMRERRAVAELLVAIGAGRDRLGERTLRDVLLSLLPGLTGGVIAALALLAVGRLIGIPSAFGHTLAEPPGLALVLRTISLLAAVAVVAAFHESRAADATRHASAAPRPRARWRELWNR